ncbi:EpsG family protein [Sphingomonas rosea]|uniref:EpsG family protein n=1 Tax=Sphingomonas rosea TaxID=335605 RepID=A0ABP7UAJ3_9SPHN
MIPYWSMWTILLLAMLATPPRTPVPGFPVGPGFVAMIVAICLMIGLRFEVGGDWLNYIEIFDWIQSRPLADAGGRSDPGYTLFNVIAIWLGADIWLVNLLSAIPFAVGLFALSRRQPEHWLALLVAFPYLVVVVAMGYTRQASAIGFVMIGLASYTRTGSIFRYLFWVALAAAFHKTAMLTVALVFMTSDQRRIVNLAILVIAAIGLYFAALGDSTDRLLTNYVGARYQSGGAAIRVSMCVVPGLLFLFLRKRFGFHPLEEKLWRNFSIAAILAAVALATTPSSTAVDRIALYLLPMQMVILPRLAGYVLETGTGRALVASYSAAVLFVWLNFGTFSRAWIPYRFWFLA